MNKKAVKRQADAKHRMSCFTNRCLSLSIISGTDLVSRDRNGFSDPYVIVKWGGKAEKSVVKKKTLNPVWNELFVFPERVSKEDIQRHDSREYKVEIQVWDWNKLGSDDFMGQLELDTQSLLKVDDEVTADYPLATRNSKDKVKVTGTLKITLSSSDISIPAKILEKCQETTKFSADKISDIWKVFAAGTEEKKIRHASRLVTLVEKCGMSRAALTTFSEKSQLDDSTLKGMKSADIQTDIGKMLFRGMDENCDGILEWSEFISGLNSISGGDAKGKALILFRAKDLNHDGSLDKEEVDAMFDFALRCLRAKVQVEVDAIKTKLTAAGFRCADLTALVESVERIWTKLTFEKSTMRGILFNYADANNDGQITQEEYLQWALDEAVQKKYRVDINTALSPLADRIASVIQSETNKLAASIK
eukprot:TRINITY_DN7278_c0_g1_i1.p1 TRINITY_DN7278_c0_g1~~TRINITY_DN7278_c0_g1_i1.p1  ORF type:complete len:430 (+),score=67.86 TRINITY_DN7278_c0_g1_i1:32-1291(+)